MQSLTMRICLLLMITACAGLPLLAQGKEAPVKKTTVHREGDRVWLEGVTGWSDGREESSVHAAQATIAQALGYDISYDYLCGVSGLAFRLQIHQDGFCGSSPHSACGYECRERAVRALPVQITSYGVKAEEAEKVKDARRAIVESIDRGVPVQYGSEEDGVIVGYQKNGDEWICFHPFHNGGKKTFVEKSWPWGIVIFTAPKPAPPARHTLVLESLRQAVTMATTKKAEKYHLGYAAWDAYIARLKKLETADDKARGDEMQGNAWIYECLAQYRAVAARYLRDTAGDFSPDAAQHLRNAADLYDEMANQVLRDKEHSTLTVAPYPSALKPGDTWTTEQIQSEVTRLEKALPLERRALEEIGMALAEIDKK